MVPDIDAYKLNTSDAASQDAETRTITEENLLKHHHAMTPRKSGLSMLLSILGILSALAITGIVLVGTYAYFIFSVGMGAKMDAGNYFLLANSFYALFALLIVVLSQMRRVSLYLRGASTLYYLALPVLGMFFQIQNGVQPRSILFLGGIILWSFLAVISLFPDLTNRFRKREPRKP